MRQYLPFQYGGAVDIRFNDQCGVYEGDALVTMNFAPPGDQFLIKDRLQIIDFK